MDTVSAALFVEHQHRASTTLDVSLHEREVAQLRAQHAERERMRSRHHQQSVRWKGVYHLQNTFYSIDIARRDAVRDSIRHKSSTTHGIMVVTSILFGCLFSIIYQFQPPVSASYAGLVILMVVMGMSLLSLVASIRVSLSLQSVLTSYHVHRPLHHYKPCNKVHATFDDFYACHCESRERWGMWLMHSGVVWTLASAAVYQYLILTNPDLDAHITTGGKGTASAPMTTGGMTGNSSITVAATAPSLLSEGPGVVFAVMCGLAILVLLIGDRCIPNKTHSGVHDYTGFLSKEEWVNRAREQYMKAAVAAEREQSPTTAGEGTETTTWGKSTTESRTLGRGLSDGDDTSSDVEMNVRPTDEEGRTREPLY